MKKIDPQKLLTELEYYIKYYGNEFKPNQGLEEIIYAIKKFSQKGKWLDLGGGSNTPFWRMFFPELDQILCMDINQEAFLLSELIINDFIESPCYKHVRQLFGVNSYENREITIQYMQADLLAQKIELDNSFDNITQFGLLGLMESEEEYIRKSEEIMRLLSENGIYIGVNWIFSKKYQERKGFSNEYIGKETISKIVNNELNLIHYQEVMIKDDPNYDKCVIYVINKKEAK